MFGLPDQAVGGIVAAIIAGTVALTAATIAGTVALLSLIISKEQKVSEFRQQWIDSLREEVAAVIAHSHGFHGSSVTNPPSDKSPWDSVRNDITGISQVSARIYLRLNPDEKNKKEKAANTAVLEALSEYDSLFGSPPPDILKLRKVSEKLLSATQIVLKINWDRVRKGEPVYRITRFLATMVAVVVVVIIGSLLYVLFTKANWSVLAH